MSSAAALAEDLPRLAAFEFKTALTECGDCTDYHALFGYGRLASHKNGMVFDADTINPLFARLTEDGCRILIVGSADSGLLAMTARATLGRNPRITIADRCATPLAVCRHYAETQGLNIKTVQADASALNLPERYDLIFVHGIVPYIPAARHAGFFQSLSRVLGEAGNAVLVSWNNSRSEREGESFAGKRRDIAATLAAKGIELPEDEAAFRARVERHDEAYRRRLGNKLEPSQIEAYFKAAGLHVRERLEHNRRTSPAAVSGQSVQSTTYFFVASHP